LQHIKFYIFIIIVVSLFSCGQKTPSGDKNIHNTDTFNFAVSKENIDLKPLLADTLNNITIKPEDLKIMQNWSLKDGWFPDQDLNFEKTDIEDYVFIFRKDGTIDYRTTNVFGSCPVGAFTMTDGMWTKDGQDLTLELRGLVTADYWYWWKVQYKIVKLTSGQLKLKVIKILKKKEIDSTLKWEDLIRE